MSKTTHHSPPTNTLWKYLLGKNLIKYQSSIELFQQNIRVFLRNKTAVFGLILVLIFLFISVFGPWIAPYPEDAVGAVNLKNKLQPPSWEHWFGTDEVGNDILTRVLIGARTSLYVGSMITGIAILIGVTLGVLSGYYRGWVEEIIMRITDMFLSIPSLVLAIAIVGALGPGIMNAMFAMSLVWWPGYVRLIHAKTLSIRNELFVESSQSLGARDVRILWRHILPNCLSPIVVKGSMDMGQAILYAASLGFLGLGAQPPFPEWGAMLSVARNYLPEWWWYSLFPGFAIYFTVLGFSLLGDGLMDILDPKQKD